MLSSLLFIYRFPSIIGLFKFVDWIVFLYWIQTWKGEICSIHLRFVFWNACRQAGSQAASSRYCQAKDLILQVSYCHFLRVVKQNDNFREKFSQVRLNLVEGSPVEIGQWSPLGLGPYAAVVKHKENKLLPTYLKIISKGRVFLLARHFKGKMQASIFCPIKYIWINCAT